MKLPAFAFTAAFALGASVSTPPLAAQPAPRVTTTLPPNELSALEAIRKDVWVNWFSGDTAALRRVLAPELVAIGPDGQLSLNQSIAGSAEYKASGGRFVSVTFNSNVAHRFGDVVVLFSRYSVVTERAKKQATQVGRATEVFVRSNGRWVHTSWHLDVTG